MIFFRAPWPLCILALPVLAAAPLSSFAPFPPAPAPEERQARNSAEREAGAVIMDAEISIHGKARSAQTRKHCTRYQYRYRYMVLDEKGVDTLSHHAFLGNTETKFTDLRGRTLTADGSEFPLDPEKDIRNLDFRDVKRSKEAPVRTVAFPHLEPGAILDLAYTEEIAGTPDFALIPLQTAVPIRRMHVTATSDFFEPWVWVPLFVGPTPLHASASLGTDYHLELFAEDLPPLKEEPLDPPNDRSAFNLGLLPRKVWDPPGKAGPAGAMNRVLFGNPSVTEPLATGGPVQHAIDPARGLVQLDDLGLQKVNEWTQDTGFLAWWQKILISTDKSFSKFFRNSKGAETPEALARVAPKDLPVEERARLLFLHARWRVTPNPRVDSQRNLNLLLKAGKGDEWDLALYYRYLLEQAGIPARILIATSRFKLPFNPVFESFRLFGTHIFVRVDNPGRPLYVMPGDPFATFATFPTGYLGSLAFEEPSAEGDSWKVVRMPTDHPLNEDYRVAMRASLPTGNESTDLVVSSTLSDAASFYFRWALPASLPPKDREKGEEALARPYTRWLDRWAGVEMKGDTPEIDPYKDTDQPLTFTLRGDWKPDVQVAGDRIILPCLPPADLLRNPFISGTRENPIWFDAGHTLLSLTWELPQGTSASRLPKATEIMGPGGLSFRMRFVAEPPSEAGKPHAITTTAEMTVPCFLPAARYEEVRTFFEAVQRAAEARLVATLGGDAEP